MSDEDKIVNITDHKTSRTLRQLKDAFQAAQDREVDPNDYTSLELKWQSIRSLAFALSLEYLQSKEFQSALDVLGEYQKIQDDIFSDLVEPNPHQYKVIAATAYYNLANSEYANRDASGKLVNPARAKDFYESTVENAHGVINEELLKSPFPSSPSDPSGKKQIASAFTKMAQDAAKKFLEIRGTNAEPSILEDFYHPIIDHYASLPSSESALG